MVYVHFRSRAGLLIAMARDRDRRSGFAARVAAARELPPAEALERLLREWLAYVPEILPVARALEAAAITGEAGATRGATGWATSTRSPARRSPPRAARDRLDGGHRHRLGVGPRASRAGFEHLVVERGWSAEDYARAHRSLRARRAPRPLEPHDDLAEMLAAQHLDERPRRGLDPALDDRLGEHEPAVGQQPADLVAERAAATRRGRRR